MLPSVVEVVAAVPPLEESLVPPPAPSLVAVVSLVPEASVEPSLRPVPPLLSSLKIPTSLPLSPHAVSRPSSIPVQASLVMLFQ
jgi:hypothetical protein